MIYRHFIESAEMMEDKLNIDKNTKWLLSNGSKYHHLILQIRS